MKLTITLDTLEKNSVNKEKDTRKKTKLEKDVDYLLSSDYNPSIEESLAWAHICGIKTVNQRTNRCCCGLPFTEKEKEEKGWLPLWLVGCCFQA